MPIAVRTSYIGRDPSFLRMRALCNGRNDLPSPPQIYGEPKRLISEMLMIFSNYLTAGFFREIFTLEFFTKRHETPKATPSVAIFVKQNCRWVSV